MQNMSWHILGPGAIGSLWMARLLDSGAAVTLIVRNQKVALQLREQGVVLESLIEPGMELDMQRSAVSRLYRPECVTVSEFNASSARAKPRIDNLLITTKSNSTLEAFVSVVSSLHESTNLVLLQNGMGNLERLMEIYPSDRWFVGTTTDGAYRKSKNHTVYAGIGKTQIGSYLKSCSTEGKNSLIKLFDVLTADIQWVDDIEPIVWRKLIVNSAINPLAVIFNCKNGGLANNTIARQKISALCVELEQLSFVEQQQWSASTMEAMILSVIEKTAENICSSLQDLRNGNTTEIDSINGFLARLAQQESVLMPVNQELLSSVKEKSGRL